jgi:hypothetical protein
VFRRTRSTRRARRRGTSHAGVGVVGLDDVAEDERSTSSHQSARATGLAAGLLPDGRQRIATKQGAVWNVDNILVDPHCRHETQA